MHRLVRLGIALVAGVVPGLLFGFLFSPDPTGATPLVVGLGVGLVLAAMVYAAIDSDGGSSTPA